MTNEDAATVAVDWRYPAGSTVPGRTGVILKGAVGDYKAEYSVANVASPENNLLDGTIEAATIADAGYKYYKLADGEKGLGFYFAVEGGSSIMNGANKAYLALPENEAQESTSLHLISVLRESPIRLLRQKMPGWMSTLFPAYSCAPE